MQPREDTYGLFVSAGAKARSTRTRSIAATSSLAPWYVVASPSSSACKKSSVPTTIDSLSGRPAGSPAPPCNGDDERFSIMIERGSEPLTVRCALGSRVHAWTIRSVAGVRPVPCASPRRARFNSKPILISRRSPYGLHRDFDGQSTALQTVLLPPFKTKQRLGV
jgi:hypothetical protein